MGHALMEDRNGLVADVRLTLATGTAERDAAVEMIERSAEPSALLLVLIRAMTRANLLNDCASETSRHTSQ
jgi:hypothetical protein